MPEKVTTRMIEELLKHKHAGPEWARFTELNQGTGGRMGRRIDFFAFNVWPSKGYTKIAYEIKLTRADFARELADPTKRGFAEKVANECYFVTPLNLVQPTEIPEGWGLYEVVANGLRRKLMATQRKVDSLPMPFMASMARIAGEPNSELPAALWLLDGQEITEADLEKAASERVQEIIESRLRKLRYEHREELRGAQQLGLDFKRVVQHKIGWDFAEPLALSKWFDSQNLQLHPSVIRALQSAHREIGEALSKAVGESNGKVA